MRSWNAFLVTTIVVLAGCSSVMQATPPAGFDLNGRWHVNPTASDAPPRREQQVDERLEDVPRQITPSRSTQMPFDPTDFPVLVAELMVIEQDRQSMGIDYGQFGYRDITFGERQSSGWDVEAGWDEARDLVVKMKRHRVRYEERYHLSEGGGRLTVAATVETRQGNRTVTRVFDREHAGR